MATLTLRITNVCAGGEHFTLTATGDVSYSCGYGVAEFTAPLTDAEKEAFLKVLVRFAKIGRTAQQVKNALIAGATVTV